MQVDNINTVQVGRRWGWGGRLEAMPPLDFPVGLAT